MSVKVIPNEFFFSGVENIIRSGGSVELNVKGSSMHPTLVEGKHKVVLVPFEPGYLRVGMVALFVYDKKHILHRLVALNAGTLVFQGDNLPYTREAVKVGDVKAFVGYIVTPRGKIVDCKGRRHVIMSRLFVSFNRARFIALKIRNRIVDLVRTWEIRN